MKKLFEPLVIRHTTVRNRICLPPMITYGFGDSAGEERINHYKQIAEGGTGLIIVEAACVSDGGQLGPNQLGIWDDRHIEGLTAMATAICDGGAAAIIQIHHAGIVGVYSHLCPDTYKLNAEVVGRKLTIDEIDDIKNAFILAGQRAYKAGFDGVELHGCHSYLISQFLNKEVNKRDDIYGTNPEKFVLDILSGIRECTSEAFIVGIRMGGFEPTLEDGIRHAQIFDRAGFDFLDVSYGFSQAHKPFAPKDFPYKDIIYAAGEIKKRCKAPVFAVNQIRTVEQAQGVISTTGVDMVDIGRATLVDYKWANKARENIAPDPCFGCKECKWYPDGAKCPGRLRKA